MPKAKRAPAESTEEKPKRGPGRPSPYEGHELQIVKEIVVKLREGTPLAEILRESDMPSHDALTDWRAINPEIERIFRRAREDGFDVIAADCLKIADDGSNDTYTDEEGNKHVDADVIQRSKLRVETRLKLLAKWDPKRYGDRLEVDQKVTGEIEHRHTMTEDRRKELMERRQKAIKVGNS